MTEQLKDALRDLAATAPTVDASAVNGGTIWRRARRDRRRAVAAAAIGFTVLLVGGMAAGSVVVSNDDGASFVAPPYDPASLAIPDEIWLPSPWTPGTSDAGPLGPLALIATAPRRTSWFHSDNNGLFGVSAATGAYRFVDLPGFDLDSSGEPTLSPDGLHIAYYVKGQPTSSEVESATTGYGVYDTVTGRLHLKPVPTTYGLRPDTLTWTGDSSRLLACYGQYVDRDGLSRGSFGAVSTASLLATRYVGEKVCAGSGFGPIRGIAGGSIGSIGESVHNLRLYDAVSGQFQASWLRRITVAPATPLGAPMVSPSGDAVALEAQPQAGIGPKLYLAREGPGQRTAVPVPTPWVVDSYGWTDEQHLLTRSWSNGLVCQDADVQTFSGPVGPDDVPQIFAVNVSTGERCLAMQLHGAADTWLNPAFAADLLARPFTPSASAPPSFRDPRIVPALGLISLVVAALALLYRLRVRHVRRTRAGPTMATDD